MTNKRVLIVYSTGGLGHVKAGKAIYEAFNLKYPDIIIKNIDVLDSSNILFKESLVKGYNFISSYIPEVWGWLYRHYNESSRHNFLKAISRTMIEKKFIAFIKDFKPDFIISTHPLPMQLVSYGKHQDIIDIMSAIVITDFGCHTLWIDKEVNYYFVADDIVKMCLTGYGVDPKKVIITGIPIELKFSQQLDRAAIIKKIGLAPDLPTVLIVGGQLSFEVLKRVIRGVLKSCQAQFIIVAGRDKLLHKFLESWRVSSKLPVKVFGFVDNMEELMTATDLIFTKAGGLTMSECLAKSLPIVIGKVIPGQEDDNVNFLVAKGAAIKVKGASSIIRGLINLIENPSKLAAMKQSSQNLGKPNAAIDLVDFVVSKL